MRLRIGRSVLALSLLVVGALPLGARAGVDSPLEEPAVPSTPDPLSDDAYDAELDAIGPPDRDPLESMNRAFFGFNQWLDGHFWAPVTSGYRMAVPEPGRRAVRRAFLNLNSAPVFVNDVLQLRFGDAGETLGRFLLNSTVGMGGLFDAGIEAGWEWHDADFGQTLALYGAPSGPYLVLPVFGPTTLRDGFGDVVDRMFEPLTYVFGIGFLGSSIQVMVGTGTGITTYEAHADELEELEQASIDFYAALRSVYLQSREAEIRQVLDASWISAAREGSGLPASIPLTGAAP